MLRKFVDCARQMSDSGCVFYCKINNRNHDRGHIKSSKYQQMSFVVRETSQTVALKGWNVCKYQHHTKAGRGRWLHYLILHQTNKIYFEMDVEGT